MFNHSNYKLPGVLDSTFFIFIQECRNIRNIKLVMLLPGLIWTVSNLYLCGFVFYFQLFQIYKQKRTMKQGS